MKIEDRNERKVGGGQNLLKPERGFVELGEGGGKKKENKKGGKSWRGGKNGINGTEK